ncbi:MAG TPA: EthD family reductase [Steroidobacteraceae bacterium]
MDRRTFSLLTAGLAAAGVSAASTTSAESITGGVKLTVLYGHPPDPDAFEKYYRDVHMPLVAAIKGARRMEAAKCLPPADGSEPPFYRVFELWFDGPEHMTAVMDTPEGKKVRADLPNFTEGTAVTRLVSRLD